MARRLPKATRRPTTASRDFEVVVSGRRRVRWRSTRTHAARWRGDSTAFPFVSGWPEGDGDSAHGSGRRSLSVAPQWLGCARPRCARPPFARCDWRRRLAFITVATWRFSVPSRLLACQWMASSLLTLPMPTTRAAASTKRWRKQPACLPRCQSPRTPRPLSLQLPVCRARSAQ